MTRSVRELAQRQSGGLAVLLLWHRGTDRLTLAVRDAGTGEEFDLAVEAADALHAFHHPYAYAASRGIACPSRPPPDRAPGDG